MESFSFLTNGAKNCGILIHRTLARAQDWKKVHTVANKTQHFILQLKGALGLIEFNFLHAKKLSPHVEVTYEYFNAIELANMILWIELFQIRNYEVLGGGRKPSLIHPFALKESPSPVVSIDLSNPYVS